METDLDASNIRWYVTFHITFHMYGKECKVAVYVLNKKCNVYVLVSQIV